MVFLQDTKARMANHHIPLMLGLIRSNNPQVGRVTQLGNKLYKIRVIKYFFKDLTFLILKSSSKVQQQGFQLER